MYVIFPNNYDLFCFHYSSGAVSRVIYCSMPREECVFYPFTRVRKFVKNVPCGNRERIGIGLQERRWIYFPFKIKNSWKEKVDFPA